MIGLRDYSDAQPPPPPPSQARELTAQTFAEHGWLQDALSLEHRPQQAQMAGAVANALLDDAPLLFEAGTGVGKSLAYLIPGIIHAIDQGRQLIVSTHTIALQEQLEGKDLPICRQLFRSRPELARYADFKSAVLVGKANYLCTTRLADALKGQQELFASGADKELARIAAWANTTKEGLRHELSPPPLPEVWEHINADSSACSRKNCDGEHCFYQRARARIRQANVIIVNHSLLFAHINAGGAKEKGGSRGVLFPDDMVILDEAHTVPEVATDHFGMRLSSYGTDRMLKYLYNPRTKRGLLRKHGGAAEQQLVLDALEASEQFFAAVHDQFLTKQAIVRVRDADRVEPYLNGPLLALIKAVSSLADKLEDGKERDELLEQRGKLKTYQTNLARWLAVGDDEQVYWAERSGKRFTIVTLRTAPIDVSPLLREALFECGVSVVCTSATLAVSDDITAFQRKIGAEGATASVAHSPFDFKRHMRIYVASDVPPPASGDSRLALDALADWIRFCTLRTQGGSLVLFTSYTDLRKTAAAIEPDLTAAGRLLLCQGADQSRTELTRTMQAAGNAILFGTESFWTGVDVPGDALSQVIVTRLPFDPPTHPVLEARAEHIREAGGSPFNELTLPEALIKFRQGIGRLIRTARDRGVVTILDSRVLSKSYGRLFLDVLPQPAYERINQETREARFKPFV